MFVPATPCSWRPHAEHLDASTDIWTTSYASSRRAWPSTARHLLWLVEGAERNAGRNADRVRHERHRGVRAFDVVRPGAENTVCAWLKKQVFPPSRSYNAALLYAVLNVVLVVALVRACTAASGSCESRSRLFHFYSAIFSRTGRWRSAPGRPCPRS